MSHELVVIKTNLSLPSVNFEDIYPQTDESNFQFLAKLISEYFINLNI
jgi:hypothetical protein